MKLQKSLVDLTLTFHWHEGEQIMTVSGFAYCCRLRLEPPVSVQPCICIRSLARRNGQPSRSCLQTKNEHVTCHV